MFSSPAASVAPTTRDVTLTRTRSAVIMSTPSAISFLNTFCSGMLTVALPHIAQDIALPNNLLLWPASVYALTLGCALLLIGAIADIIGNRAVFITGTALFSVFTLACSLSRTATELIALRALQGIAMAHCMPTAVSTITNTFPSGPTRNVAFAAFGGGSPIGFATGLVLGGVLVQVVGWRAGFYMASGISLSAISSDLLFNISNLVITASFSAEDQALSGGVFNTVAQLGNAIGLAVTAVIASAATSSADSKSSVTELEGTLKGYQAALWACFAAAIVSTLVGILGLRKSGKVGLKRD